MKIVPLGMLAKGILVRRWARGEPNNDMNVPCGVNDRRAGFRRPGCQGAFRPPLIGIDGLGMNKRCLIVPSGMLVEGFWSGVGFGANPTVKTSVPCGINDRGPPSGGLDTGVAFGPRVV